VAKFDETASDTYTKFSEGHFSLRATTHWKNVRAVYSVCMREVGGGGLAMSRILSRTSRCRKFVDFVRAARVWRSVASPHPPLHTVLRERIRQVIRGQEGKKEETVICATRRRPRQRGSMTAVAMTSGEVENGGFDRLVSAAQLASAKGCLKSVLRRRL
jgi:hypothetical protein